MSTDVPPMVTPEIDPTTITGFHESWQTYGPWTTEIESAQAFDEAADVDLWSVHREVPGVLAQPRPGQAAKGMRIDRILVPGEKLVEMGWQHGIVGVEIKRSGLAIGPPLAQAMDYSRSVWTLPGGGFKVWLDWVFIWPMPRQNGPIASILAQNRLGSALATNHDRLHLKSGEGSILRIQSNGVVAIGDTAAGRRSGSR